VAVITVSCLLLCAAGVWAAAGLLGLLLLGGYSALVYGGILLAGRAR
jgi:hypothetical protein